MNSLDYLLIFNTAFLFSIGHCVGMCGGIVLLINSKITSTNQNPLLANLLYNSGRISSYALIGILCGGIGIAFQINPTIQGISLIIIGLLVFLFGACFLFAPKFISYLEPSPLNHNRLKSIFHQIFSIQSPISFYFIGIFNGFLPCGIVYYFALIALSSGSIIGGISVMGIFGFATLLPMFLLGLFSNLLMNSFFKDTILKLSAFLMMSFGIYSLYKGILLL